MHKFSRTLLTLGVLAFGTLTAACETVEIIQPVVVNEVTSVTVSPSNATISIGTSIQLAANVLATGNAARTVTWTSSNAAIATVSATGQVTAPASSPGGTVTIIATSTADATKQGAAAIVVTPPAPVQPVPPPSISINSVLDNFGNPVNLSNAAGQINVTVNVSNTLGGTGLIEVFVSSCASNAIGATEVPAATQALTAGQTGQVTLAINTAQLNTSNAPRWPNGNFCIKARVTASNGTAVAANTTPITLNNTNIFRATLTWTNSPRKTGSPVSAVSTVNGLNYNSGNLGVVLNPVVFTSSSPVALISGYLTLNGQQNGVIPAACSPNLANACITSFTNIPVTAGAATLTFTDTSATGVRSIFNYTSMAAGDTLYITSATDAAGNPITVTPTPGSPGFVAAAPGGIRIDNDAPTLAAYTVTAPNGYVGAAYAFSSGTTGTSSDLKAGVQGVGGITTRYYVGAAGSAAFATANSCNITGLTQATTGNDLANTPTTDTYDAKVVVADALGNMICTDIASTFGPLFFFGVDKVTPTVSMTTANNGAADVTGYNVSKNFSFIYNDSISGFTPATPIRGTLVRNFFTTPSAADCVIGTFSATALTCSTVAITVTSNFGTPPNAGGSIEFTNGTAIVGYYTIVAAARDRALNTSGTVSRIAAFDNVAPAVALPTQSPAAAVPLGTVTVSATATDNFDLASSSGRLQYFPVGSAPTPVSFASVAGTSFGPNFDATMVTSGTAVVALPNVYRGLQGVDGTNVILANRANPTAQITVVDVGTNQFTSGSATIATSTVGANIQATPGLPITFVSTPTSAAPTTRQTTTNLTTNVGGTVADPAFQSQPFAVIEFYKLTAGELVLVGSVTGVTVTDIGANRTYTYAATSVPLTGGAVNTFYAVGRNAAGDAVISNAITVTNP